MTSQIEGVEVAEFATDVGQTATLIAQLLSRSSGGKLSQSDIGEAIATVADLHTAAATLELWRSGQIEFGWDSEESELVLCSTDIDGESAGHSRIVFGERN